MKRLWPCQRQLYHRITISKFMNCHIRGEWDAQRGAEGRVAPKTATNATYLNDIQSKVPTADDVLRTLGPADIPSGVGWNKCILGVGGSTKNHTLDSSLIIVCFMAPRRLSQSFARGFCSVHCSLSTFYLAFRFDIVESPPGEVDVVHFSLSNLVNSLHTWLLRRRERGRHKR